MTLLRTSLTRLRDCTQTQELVGGILTARETASLLTVSRFRDNSGAIARRRLEPFNCVESRCCIWCRGSILWERLSRFQFSRTAPAAQPRPRTWRESAPAVFAWPRPEFRGTG